MRKKISNNKRIFISVFTFIIFVFLLISIVYTSLRTNDVSNSLQGLIVIIGIIFIVLENIAISMLNKKYEAEYYKSDEYLALKSVQDRRLSLEQARIDEKKLKYKRIKCKYCGSKNKITSTTCINCGGELEQFPIK